MKVTFAVIDEEIASSRLRAMIPQRELAAIGIDRGYDVLVYGKHVVSMRTVKRFKRCVFDICDDHFRNDDLRQYYLMHADNADAITCNSAVMRDRIKEETGRDAEIISEPYESNERKPSIGPRLLWFGHRSNIADLERIEGSLRHPLLALSNRQDLPKWTQETFNDAMNHACIVIIPTGKSVAKSENRMVESIRCGKYVCAEHLPSYEAFAQFFPLGDIPAHIDAALADEDGSLERIKVAQDYIRERYAPSTIARDWLRVLNEHIKL